MRYKRRPSAVLHEKYVVLKLFLLVSAELLISSTDSSFSDKSRFKPSYTTLQKCIQNVWNIILRWNSRNNNHKKTLVFLIEAVLPHLFKPILTMDYLMDSLNAGNILFNFR